MPEPYRIGDWLDHKVTHGVHKAEAPLAPAEALEWIEQLEAFPCQAIEPSLVKIGAEISQRYQISYWDGAILTAAEALGRSEC